MTKRALVLTLALALFAPLTQGVAAVILINFDGIAGTNFGAISSAYQPLAGQGITMTYSNVGLYNLGPDHTNGTSGGTRWSTFEENGENTVMSISFSSSVSAPSMWLTTFFGGTSGRSLDVVIRAYSDTAGTNLIFTDTFTTPAHAAGAGNYVWAEYTGLASVPSFQRFSLTTAAGGGTAQLDDLRILAVPEPSVMGLLAVGGGGLIFRRRRKR